MRAYTVELAPKNVLVSITCNKCKREMADDEMERQEMLSFHDVGGYSCVFGDGTEYQIDLCQHCVKELLGEYVHYPDDEVTP